MSLTSGFASATLPIASFNRPTFTTFSPLSECSFSFIDSFSVTISSQNTCFASSCLWSFVTSRVRRVFCSFRASVSLSWMAVNRRLSSFTSLSLSFLSPLNFMMISWSSPFSVAKSTPFPYSFEMRSKFNLSLVFSRVSASRIFFDTPGVTMAPWDDTPFFSSMRLNCVILFSALDRVSCVLSSFSATELSSSFFSCSCRARFWIPTSRVDH